MIFSVMYVYTIEMESHFSDLVLLLSRTQIWCCYFHALRSGVVTFTHSDLVLLLSRTQI